VVPSAVAVIVPTHVAVGEFPVKLTEASEFQADEEALGVVALPGDTVPQPDALKVTVVE